MTILVTIGCSHTAGSMADGRNGSGWKNKELSFGGQLAAKHKLSHYNMGAPGASNEYIYKTTIRFINNHMHKHDDYIFLLGWTSTSRMELRYPENSKYVHSVVGDFIDQKHIPYTSGTDPKLFHTREAKELCKYAPLVFHEKNLIQDWAVYAYTLQELFKHKKIKYYMLNTCHELPIINENKIFIENLDTDLYYEPTDFDSCLLYYALGKGFEKTSCWHLKADGHAMWAEHLDTLMSAQGLFDNLKQPKIVPKDNSIRIAGKYITSNDIAKLIEKYKMDVRMHLDDMYDRLYIQFPEKDNDYSSNVKINVLNKELVRRYGQSAKISKKHIGYYDMDNAFMLEHFRNMS
tara:strand:+ start:8109 stop:9152 length:1044 start_codon:yes stop_codon:yes gene_type:complete